VLHARRNWDGVDHRRQFPRYRYREGVSGGINHPIPLVASCGKPEPRDLSGQSGLDRCLTRAHGGETRGAGVSGLRRFLCIGGAYAMVPGLGGLLRLDEGKWWGIFAATAIGSFIGSLRAVLGSLKNG